MKKEKLLLGIFVLLVVFWSAYSYFNEGVIYFLVTNDFDAFAEYIKSFGDFAVAVFILITIIEVVAAPIPPLILYVSAGLIFGAFFGGTIVLVGNIIGAVIAFYIARVFGKRFVDENSDRKLKNRFDKFFENYGVLSIFLLRVNPFTSSDIVSYLAGLTKIKWWHFTVATALGLIPLIYVQTYLGDSILRGNVFLTWIFIVVSIVYLLLIVYWIVKWVSKRKSN